jgi:hypothetical protein
MPGFGIIFQIGSRWDARKGRRVALEVHGKPFAANLTRGILEISDKYLICVACADGRNLCGFRLECGSRSRLRLLRVLRIVLPVITGVLVPVG